jgi:hypothetical protein
MIAVLIGILLNHSRLSDVRTDMNNLKVDMRDLRAVINRQFAHR